MSFGGDDRIQRIILALGIEGEEIGDRVVQIIRDLIAAQDDAKRSAIELGTAAAASADARRMAAQGARELAQAEKELAQQFDAELQAFVTSTLATHQSEEALRSRARAADAAVRSQQAIVQAVDLMAQHEATAKVAIDATTEARNRNAGSADEAGRRAMALTRTIYFAAQGFEDLQYGFNSFVNNIPLITMSAAQAMGKSTEAAMAWGAGLSILGVVINSALIPALKGIVDRSPALTAFFHELNVQLNPFHVETYGDRISKLGEHLKELEGKKIKLAVDISDLERTRKELQEAKKDKEAFDDAMTGRSKAEREAGKAVEEAITEAPAGEPEIAARMAAQFAQQGLAGPKARDKQAEVARLTAARADLERRKQQGELVTVPMEREADRLLENAQEEMRQIQLSISENARNQAGRMIRLAKEGRAKDVEAILPFLRGFEKAPDIGIGPVAGDLSKQVEAAADRAREQVAIDRDIPALKKVADENEKVRKAAVQDQQKAETHVAAGFRPKLQEAIDERGAQLIKEGKSDEEIKKALEEFVAERLKTAGVRPGLIQGGTAGIVEEGMQKLQAAIAGRTGAGRAEAAGEVLADIEEKRKRAAEAQDARERRRAAPTPEEREHQREVERQARGLEGGRGGLAEQLTPAILARMARGEQTEQIIAGLAPQVAGRVGRIPTVPAGMAPDISRQIVQDVLAKQGAPMAGEMAFAPNAQLAAMGLQAQGAAKAMEGAQRQGRRADAAQQAMQERGLAQMFAAQGATNQQALTMAHRTVNLMQHGIGVQQAMLQAWNEMSQRLNRVERQQQQVMHQMHRMRFDNQNRGGMR